MPVLNHHIVSVRDADASARFFAEVLGFEPPVRLGHFALLQVSADTTFDFLSVERDVEKQHYAFLVTDNEFDDIFARVRERGLDFWGDPLRKLPGEINELDDGRGLYFDDPDGHQLEILTRPYGSGGLDAEHVNPLLLGRVEHRSATETPWDSRN
ncbi:VOC family protein [Amycolatopsis sp. NPDC098790]|uniref:VOC family protein n=1 Tax=Amycolatopsis sp. NPDC098790 TaxID=3363939 RepID=UPI00380C533D